MQHHVLTEIDAENRMAVCAVCGLTRIKPRTNSRGWKGWRCRNKENERRRGPLDLRPYDVRNRYRVMKGDVCEACGFVPFDICQLDVDHKDGDHFNNDPANLWTLCANCHRLKTFHPEAFQRV